MTVFDRIYYRNEWRGTASRSGPGSDVFATFRLAPRIVSLVHELGVTSVLDVGCGDGYWQPDLPGYVGIDPTLEAVERASKRRPDRDYRVARSPLEAPRSELVMVRDVIQHLPLAAGAALLADIRATGARWLLCSTFDPGANTDVEEGECYSPDMLAEPFSLGAPERAIFDGYQYHDPDEVRDPSKYLALWDLSLREAVDIGS